MQRIKNKEEVEEQTRKILLEIGHNTQDEQIGNDALLMMEILEKYTPKYTRKVAQ
ncbi:hypothetical protein [Helicobacter mustelae]|uniref:hypothetical protein n=1 Tax=Helicobacter mustelae TaxID=217 RepID=UPI000324B8C6|nr:hypothetical protein [Helicobacter mustelae]